MLGLLSFLSTKFDDLTTTGGVEQLLKEVHIDHAFFLLRLIVLQTILLLNLSLSKSEIYLPTPRSLHEFIVCDFTTVPSSVADLAIVRTRSIRVHPPNSSGGAQKAVRPSTRAIPAKLFGC